MIQFQSDSLNMIEARLSRLKNMRRIKKTLPTQSLTIPNILAMLMKIKNHGILKILTNIQFHHKTLNLTNINPLTNWQVFILMKLNLNMNVTPTHNFVIQFQFFNLY